MKITNTARTIQPTLFKAWVVDRETQKDEMIEVEAFSVKEAMELVRSVGTVDEEGNTIEGAKSTYKIRVCVEAEKYDEACAKWVDRLEANKIKNNARNIGRVKEVVELLSAEGVKSKTIDKVLEIVGLDSFKEYLD